MYSVFKNIFNLGIFQGTGMLLQLLVIPLITRNYGLSIFGEIAFSTSIGLFLANLVNYGSNQTDVKDVSIYRNNTNKLSSIVSDLFFLRMIVFSAIFLITTGVIITTKYNYLGLWFSVLPMIACEIFNPMYFLVGIEKIQWITYGNIIARAISLGLIVFIHLTRDISVYLNLMLSFPLLIYYGCLFFYLIREFNLTISLININDLKKKLKDNFYVTFNGSSVILQQSIFMFAISGTVSPSTIGAYGIIDKLLGAFRQLVSAFSTAIYPKAARLFHDGKSIWIIFRNKVQVGYTFFFLFTGLFLFVFADFASIIFAHKEDQNTILFFRFLSFAPLVLALNANNVLQLLLEMQYKKMFQISLVIIFSTIVISYLLTRYFNETFIGLYPLIIESVCLIIYTLFIRFKNRKSLV